MRFDRVSAHKQLRLPTLKINDAQIMATLDQEKIFLVETKGNDKINDRNVRQKQTAAVEWCRKINELPAEKRMEREWEYVLLDEETFYRLANAAATITDICARCRVSLAALTGDLFSLLS